MPSQTVVSLELPAIDLTDVPLVAMRELATALKFLTDDAKLIVDPVHLTEDAMRRVEQAYWQRCNRDRTRKVAVLVRLRSLLEACRARTIQSLIAVYGQAAVLEALSVAATMRLNTKIGFSPVKLSQAVSSALKPLQNAPAARRGKAA
jgi:hypothetical protein